MAEQTLDTLFHETLKDIYYAERKILSALPKMARGAQATVQITADVAPLLAGVETLLAQGVRTGASGRNWASYGEAVDGLEAGLMRDLLTDPQTSGGLLIACAPEAARTPAMESART